VVPERDALEGLIAEVTGASSQRPRVSWLAREAFGLHHRLPQPGTSMPTPAGAGRGPEASSTPMLLRLETTLVRGLGDDAHSRSRGRTRRPHPGGRRRWSEDVDLVPGPLRGDS